MHKKPIRTYLITGVAGFIGSQLADRLLSAGHTVIGLDNLSRGSLDNIQDASKNKNFIFFKNDIANDLNLIRDGLSKYADGKIDFVWHLAANSDIANGVRDPEIDLKDTFLTTFNLLILMRELRVPEIAFASTSAVYGSAPGRLTESAGPLLPISNYGAMKLASEGLISAAAESFLKRAYIFRFPNVIGPRLTHGVIFDLLHKLRKNREALEVLGDGRQQKPYLYASDLIDAMMYVVENSNDKLALFNIGPLDDGATVAEIVDIILSAVDTKVIVSYTGGARGWVGDVPKFSYSIDKLLDLGWTPAATSLDAIERTVAEVAPGVLN